MNCYVVAFRTKQSCLSDSSAHSFHHVSIEGILEILLVVLPALLGQLVSLLPSAQDATRRNNSMLGDTATECH